MPESPTVIYIFAWDGGCQKWCLVNIQTGKFAKCTVEIKFWPKHFGH